MPDQDNIINQKTVIENSQVASPPAYFLSLTVENIRCFGPKQVLDLSDGKGRPAPWTIILGDNGFGKTTLLQCLEELQPNLYEWRYSYPKDKEHEESLYYWQPKLSSLSDSIERIKNLTRKIPSSLKCCVAFGSELTSSEKISTSDSLYLKCDYDAGFETNMADPSEGEDVGGLICYAYSATRRMSTGTLSSLSERQSTDSSFSNNGILINAEEWYLRADYSSHRSRSGKSRNQQAQVKKALIALLPDVDNIRIADSSDGFRVEVKTPFGWVHIQSLSLGYRTLIAWVVDLAHRLFERYPNSQNPLAEPAVVLVDEIDLHLHPRFQRTLMDYLTNLFPNTQFIATAHSPLVVQAASKANIALLRREGDHIVIDNDVEAIANWRIDQVLTSDLFGLESARPPQYDALLKERTRLLSKARLTKADREKLKDIEAQIGDLPTGETPDDIKAMDIIRQAAQQLTNFQGK